MRSAAACILLFSTAVLSAQVARDFNGDGKSDVFWVRVTPQPSAIGQPTETSVWLMDGTSVTASRATTFYEPDWRPVSFGDYNGDGKADVFWWNQTTGETSLWFMNGGDVALTARSFTLSDLAWQVVGSGDFDGDGMSDLLWFNVGTHETCVWLMNGNVITTAARLFTLPLNWAPTMFGDYDGDGKDDIFLADSATNHTCIWFMNGAAIANAVRSIDGDPTKRPFGGGDFDASTKSDVFWGQRNNGSVAGPSVIWLMNGATATVGPPLDSGDQEVLFGDFDGDGKCDVFVSLTLPLVRTDTGIWFMDGATIQSQQAVLSFEQPCCISQTSRQWLLVTAN